MTLQARWSSFKSHRPTIYLCSILMMAIMGAASPLTSRMAYSENSFPCQGGEGCEERPFKDFMALTWFKYIVTTLVSLSLWGWDYRRFKKGRKAPFFSNPSDIVNTNRKNLNWSRYFLIIFCSIFDVGFSTFQRTAMIYTYAANVQIMSNFVVILSAFLKMMIPREALFVREWLAVLIITTGLLCTSIDSLMNPPLDTTYDESWKGIVFALLAATCKALQVNIEHKLYRKYNFPPMKFMTVSGVFSIGWCFVLSGAYFGMGSINPTEGFWMVVQNPALFGLAFTAGLTAGGFNLSSSIVQKFTSSVHREIFSMNAVVLTWLVEVIAQIRPFEAITFFAEVTTLVGILFNSGVWRPIMPACMERPITFGGKLLVQEGLILGDDRIEEDGEIASKEPEPNMYYDSDIEEDPKDGLLAPAA